MVQAGRRGPASIANARRTCGPARKRIVKLTADDEQCARCSRRGSRETGGGVLDQHMLQPHCLADPRPEERPERVLEAVPVEDQAHSRATHVTHDVRRRAVDRVELGVVSEPLSLSRQGQHVTGADESAGPRRGEARQGDQAEDGGPRCGETAAALERNADQGARQNEQGKMQPAVPGLPLEGNHERERARHAQSRPAAHRDGKRLTSAPDDHDGGESREELERVADEILVDDGGPDLEPRERAADGGPAVVGSRPITRWRPTMTDSTQPFMRSEGPARWSAALRRTFEAIARGSIVVLTYAVQVGGSWSGLPAASAGTADASPRQRQCPAEMPDVQRHDAQDHRQDGAQDAAATEREGDRHEGDGATGPQETTPAASSSAASPALLPTRVAVPTPGAARNRSTQSPSERSQKLATRSFWVLLAWAMVMGRVDAGHRCQPARPPAAAELAGHDGRAHGAAGERQPLHEVRQAVAAGQEVQVHDRELGPGP